MGDNESETNKCILIKYIYIYMVIKQVSKKEMVNSIYCVNGYIFLLKYCPIRNDLRNRQHLRYARQYLSGWKKSFRIFYYFFEMYLMTIYICLQLIDFPFLSFTATTSAPQSQRCKKYINRSNFLFQVSLTPAGYFDKYQIITMYSYII